VVGDTLSVIEAWFRVRNVKAHSHFPMTEVPDEIAAEIERFVVRDT
jgi:hypothetical protein